MEKDPNLRFVCKFCNKKYPCGKSLGGHIRSHVIAAESEEENMEIYSGDGGYLKSKAEPPPESNELGGASGYGLRENPKRTWRAVDSTFSLPQERICKQCGKGFQSLKALCGHMACHSEKERVLREDYSWTTENTKLVDSDSDNEDQMMRQTRSKTKRYNKSNVVKSSHFVNDVGAYSPVCGIEEQDVVEDVAMCLMMLSRDYGNWGGVNSIVESSDNNSVVLETRSSSIDMKTGRNEGFDFRDQPMKMMKRKLKSSALDSEGVHFEKSCSGYLRNGFKKVESDSSFDELLWNEEYKKNSDINLGMIYNRGKRYETERNRGLNMEMEFGHVGGSSKLLKFDTKKRARREDGYDYSDVEPSNNSQKKRKYECSNCNKTFGSYQALGGHRPCHRKSNTTFHFGYESDDNSVEDDKITRNATTPIRMLGERSNNKKPVDVGAEKRIKPNKNKGHQCPFCPRMFKSGQALGGHKRSHFINGSEDFVNPTPEIKQEGAEAATTRKLIDLNLPAPEEDVEPHDSNHYIYVD